VNLARSGETAFDVLTDGASVVEVDLGVEGRDNSVEGMSES
jgi:hypothetical protein